MKEDKLYYSLVKYVSNVLTGEFITVGIIVGSDTFFKYRFSNAKIKLVKDAMFVKKSGGYELLKLFLKSTATEFKVSHYSFDDLKKLHTTHNNMVQFTEPKWVLLSPTNSVFDNLYKKFV